MEVLEVARGDTLTGLLIRAGGNAKDARRAIRSLRKIYDPDRLRPGQRLVVRTGLEGTAQRLDEVVIETSKKRAMVVARRDGRGYSARRAKRGELAAAIESAHSLAKARPARPVAEPEPSLPRRLDHPDLADLSGARPKTVTVGRGGTLMGALVAAGADPDEANAAVRSARALFDPRKLRAGQQVSLAFLDPDTEDDGARPRLASLALAIGPDTQLKVARLGKGGFAAGLIARPLVRTLARVDGIIESSLYDAAIAAGLPVDVLMKLVRVFSYDVDFQRDIQKRDRFQLLYERFADESGNPVRSGSILYAEMTLSGTALALYRHRLDDGLTDHFDDLGQSVRKALMRTPIDGARLSSSFGMRRHPIQGYNKMHRGVDFAASRGTPIFAAGDGVVERASRYKSYGKYVRLRHSPDYGTAYGHLRAYAQGIYPGKRVKQGQVIGFVGSTGRSTGPHLHYEVLHHGRQVNPMSVKLPTGLKLTGTELARFEAERDRVRRQFAALPGRRAVAEHSSPAAAAGR